MKKIILVCLICLFGFVSYSQSYVYRVKVRAYTNEGWVRDTVYCQVFHEAKNFKDMVQIFDYRIYAAFEKINGDDGAIERGQFRTNFYCWGNIQTKDSLKWFIQKKYNLELYPLRVNLLSSP